MSEQKNFQKALSDFTYEAASGGAIRHLADLGYSIKQIEENLSFPTPYERIQKTVWEHFMDTGVLLLEEPGKERHYEKVDFVKEYGKYGKISFRQITDKTVDTKQIYWKEHYFNEDRDGKLMDYLSEKCQKNEQDEAYVSCDFGFFHINEPKKFDERMLVLNKRQRDYVTGLFCQKKMVYHRLDSNMREIVIRLYEKGVYHGNCYFIKTEEKIVL